MLTELEIKRSAPGHKDYKLFDNGTGAITGFHVLIKKNGSKLFRLKFHMNGKEQSPLSLGVWPERTLASARKAAIDARRMILDGINPCEVKRKARVTGKTFREIAELNHEKWKAGKAPAHVNRVHARMKRDILPVIGSRAIGSINAPDVVALCRKVEARGVGETARRVFEDCNAVFSHGIAIGACERNPCAEIRASTFLKATVKRNHARVPDAEIPAVVRALWSHPGIVTRMAAKFTVQTGLRTANVIGLEWTWVNLDAGEIRFPSEEMKIRNPFVCVLSAHAVDVLKFMHQMSGSGHYVFPGHKRGEHLSNGAMLKALRDAGFGGKMTQHAWRAVFTTWAAEKGYSKDHVDAQLHHVRKGVRAHYDFAAFIPQRRELMNAWGAHLESIVPPLAMAAD